MFFPFSLPCSFSNFFPLVSILISNPSLYVTANSSHSSDTSSTILSKPASTISALIHTLWFIFSNSTVACLCRTNPPTPHSGLPPPPCSPPHPCTPASSCDFKRGWWSNGPWRAQPCKDRQSGKDWINEWEINTVFNQWPAGQRLVATLHSAFPPIVTHSTRVISPRYALLEAETNFLSLAGITAVRAEGRWRCWRRHGEALHCT